MKYTGKITIHTVMLAGVLLLVANLVGVVMSFAQQVVG